MGVQVPLIFSCNDHFVPYLSVMLSSVLEQASDENQYEVIILYREITPEYQRRLCEQVETKRNFSIRLVDVSRFVKDTAFYIGNRTALTAETYYRLLAPFLLEEFDWAIYMDGDMVACRDVAELIDRKLDGTLILAVRDFCGLAELYDPETSRRRYMENDLGLACVDDYFIAGLLVMDLKEFRKRFSMEELINFSISRQWQFHDQDILNVLAQGKTQFLDPRWNVLQNYGKHHLLPKHLYQEWKLSCKDPYIVHYGGHMKPWLYARVPNGRLFWHYAKRSPFYGEIKARRKQAWQQDSNYRRNYILQLFFPLGSFLRRAVSILLKPIRAWSMCR